MFFSKLQANIKHTTSLTQPAENVFQCVTFVAGCVCVCVKCTSFLYAEFRLLRQRRQPFAAHVPLCVSALGTYVCYRHRRAKARTEHKIDSIKHRVARTRISSLSAVYVLTVGRQVYKTSVIVCVITSHRSTADRTNASARSHTAEPEPTLHTHQHTRKIVAASQAKQMLLACSYSWFSWKSIVC